jgi:hypothetical protein
VSVHRGLIATLAALAMQIVFVASVAATTTSFQGVFRETFGRSAAPSGVGRVAGIGPGTEQFAPLATSSAGDCSREPGVTTLTFDSGVLYLLEDNILCTPGDSAATTGASVSYGNPVLWSGTYTITGGTGAFEGASGVGSTSGSLAGELIVIRYEGTISTP